MREIEVLGIKLKERTVREEMRRVDEMFEESGVSLIGLITMKGLISAKDSEEVSAFIESLYMTVISDEDILTAAGSKQRARYYEVETNAFMHEFLKKLYREKKSVYLISGGDAPLSALKAELVGYEEHLKIVGESIIDSQEAYETAINAVNNSGADVLISNLPTPLREDFSLNNSRMINVPVWLILREDRETTAKQSKLTRWLFKWVLNRYNSENH